MNGSLPGALKGLLVIVSAATIFARMDVKVDAAGQNQVIFVEDEMSFTAGFTQVLYDAGLEVDLDTTGHLVVVAYGESLDDGA